MPVAADYQFAEVATIAPPARFEDCQFADLDDTPEKIVGDYVIAKYRQRAAVVGVPTVARQLKKQGFDAEIAVLILAVRS